MRDHLLNWHEKFQPLGPALKTPRIEVDEKAPLSDFETIAYEFSGDDLVPSIARFVDGQIQEVRPIHPACTGGNAPSLSPQALVTSPAARFRVGDRVRVHGKYTGTIVRFHEVTGGPRLKMDDDACVFIKDEDGLAMFPKDDRCLEHIQPSDTQQWVEWKGGECPVPQGLRIEVRMRDGWSSNDTRQAGGLRWTHRDWPGDIVAYRVVQ